MAESSLAVWYFLFAACSYAFGCLILMTETKPLPPVWMVAKNMPHAKPGGPGPKPFIGPREPFSDDQIRAMKAQGDTISTIIERLRQRQNMRRDQVRAILFGRPY